MFLRKFVVLILVVTLLAIASSIEFESLRTIEGYPSGFLSDCPGSTKEARIKKSSLKHLSVVLFDKGDFLTAKRTNFNFFQMKELARNMDFKKKTILYMNGYLDSAYRFPYSSIMGTVYKKLGYNVLMLDYFWFSIMVYPRAVRFLRPVAERSAEMLSQLTGYGLDPKKVELLGLSLGGHGIGFIAKHYRYLTGRNVSRITALDPCGPCFRHLGPEDRISASDADFVDIIHTNIDGYGMATQLGHVDYYVNGGEFQISDIPEIPCSAICSHLKSFLAWLASLQYPENFIAVKCNTIQDARDRNCYVQDPVTNLMGLKADRNKTGIFYLAADYFYPYYLGENGVKKEYDPLGNYVRTVNADDVLIY